MHQRLVLRHLSGSRTNRVDKFGVEGRREVTLGAAGSCSVPFGEPDEDELVAPMHARILIEGSAPAACSVMDLNTRAGTFVNQQRIMAAVRLVPGDVIQLGPGGPEIQFDLEPRPAGTRPVRVTSPAPKPLSVAAREERPRRGAPPSARRLVWLAGVLLAAALVSALAWWNAKGGPAGDSSAGQAAAPAAEEQSLVYLEAGWRLVEAGSGRPLHHVYLPNAMKDATGGAVAIVREAGAFLPVFVQYPGETSVEPLLTLSDAKGTCRLVGGAHTGCGFALGAGGALLSDRHVIAAWQTHYPWPPDVQAGLVYGLDRNLKGSGRRVIAASEFPAWRPAAARAMLAGPPESDARELQVRRLREGEAEGRNEYLNGAFARERLRFPVRLVRASKRSDAALARIEAPRELRPMAWQDTYDTIRAGDALKVMGFPIPTEGRTAAGGGFVPDLAAQPIPPPRAGAARLTRIVRESAGQAAGEASGGIYGLVFAATGSLNSGGPVLDSRGVVVGIHSSGWPIEGQGVESSAVPIREGVRLLHERSR